jgi:transcriptional regulator with XRE-family HTH domain
MDVSFAVRERLELLGLGQKDLARAAGVTESYISQLLARKKAPPAPERTDIYPRMERFLQLPRGELARLADSQRKAELKQHLGGGLTPLFSQTRALILRKCRPEREREVRAVFEAHPFGELERLVTQKLLDVVKRMATAELKNDYWLRKVASLSGRSLKAMRVIVLDFLDTDIFHLSVEQRESFLDPLIVSWDIDLTTFGLEIVLNQQVAAEQVRRFEFLEQGPEGRAEEPGLHEFLADASMSGDATAEEIAFLQSLRFSDKRPTPLYYYRELQSLRDPLHFRTA